MPFDLEGALRAGYSMSDIANFLGEKKKFNVAGAREAGYSDADILRELTKEAPKTTVGGEVKEFFKGIPTGAIGLGETAIAGASALLPEDYEKAVRESVGAGAAALKKPFQAAPGYEDTIGRKFGQAVGSTIPFFAAAPFGVPGLVAGATTGVAAGAGESRIRAEEKGATGDERALATALGIVPGLLDVVAPEIKLGKTIISRALIKGGVEGATEAAQNVAQNLIAKGIYNPEQPILEGTAEEGAYGAGAGALASFLVDAVAGRRARVGSSEKPEGASTAPPIATTAQMPLGGVPELGEGYEGYRLPPEPYREAEEKEGARQNRLFQITELRDQHDVLMREIDRLKAQFESSTATPEQKQAILEQADKYNAARADLQEQIKQLSKGLEDTERAGAVATPEQRGLDFDMPAMPRQQTGEGVVLGEQPAAPTLMAPEQVEFFRQQRIKSIQDRMVAGEMVTPADMAFLKMDEREQRALFEAQPTPDLFAGEERPEFRLGPQYLTPAPAEAAPVAEGRPVTENDFKAMGIGATNKKLREALLGKDLTDPAQRAEVREMLSDFANDPNRSQRIIEGVEKFLTSSAFMEQGELDFGKPKRTRTKKTTGVSNVIEPTEPVERASEPSPAVAEQRGEAPAGGVEAPESSGVDVAGGVAEQPDVGAGVQPAALTEEPSAPLGGKVPTKEAMRRTASEAELKGADQHASDLGGRVVWQQGDTSLVRGYSALTGAPVYVATKGDMRTRVDVDTYTGAMFTPEEKAAMSAAKQEVEQADAQAHKDNPFINFSKGNIQTSANTPKGLGEVVSGWANLLGLKANIYITTMEDARADADKYTGPHRAIGSAVLDPNNIGVMRRMADGSYYIAFTASSSKTAMLETLAHELGHIHMKETYANANPALQNAVRAEFDKWLMSQKNKTARELVDSLRAKTTAKGTKAPEGMSAMQLREYWRSFDEWYADQVSRWATTDAKPVSVVEKFFARLGRALRNFFAKVQNQKYLANETFVQYLEEMREAAARPESATGAGVLSAMSNRVIDATTANFKKWFGNSVIRNPNGTPKVMYHGTARDIESFVPKQAGAIFVTDDPRFAEGFAYQSEEWMQKHAEEFFTPAQIEKFRKEGAKIAKREGTDASDETARLMVEALPSNANIIPVYVRAEKPFDFSNPAHLAELKRTISLDAGTFADIQRGDWGTIESPAIQEAIQFAGFDGFYVMEGGRKNLAVYDSTQLKSPFNKGSYSLADKRISYQKRVAEAETLTDAGREAAALNEQMKGISNPRPDGVDTVAKGLLGMHKFYNRGENDPSFRTYLRGQVVDKDASANEKIHAKFDNKVMDYVSGKIRADLLVDQSQDHAAVAEVVLEKGAPVIGKDGLVEVVDSPDNMKNVFSIITDKLGKRLGSADLAMQIAHNAGIAKRASEINKRNEQYEQQAQAAEAKKNFKAAKQLREAIVTVRASQEEIDAGLKALQMYPEINEALDMFTRYNSRLIDFMVASGRIDEATAANWKANTGYVPWTRVEEEVNAFEDAPVRGKVGLLNVGKLPILDRQGSSKEISNIFDNMIGHTSWVIRTALTARAANAMAEGLPDAKEIKSDDELQQELKKNRSRVIFTYKNGERTPYLLGSAADMSAFMIAPDVIPGIAKPFKAFSDILRNFVTHMPAFALGQLIQDGTYRGMMLSGVEKPFSLPPKVFGNFYKILTGESGIAAELARLGVSGVYDGMPDHVIARSREKFGLKEKTAFQKAWGSLEKFSLAADLAVRAAIYEQTLAETKTDAMPEGDRALAYYRAKEYINFKRAGANPIVRGLRHVVPFMNAYIQGMDVLVRTMQGKGVSTADKRVAMQLFWATGAKLAALNVLYTLLVGDDDEYKGLDEYERAKNYIIPGTGVKLPVAPELGFMFKVIPELMTNYIVSQGTERPDDAANVYRAMRDAFVNSYGGVNLTPQLIKPALEVAVNYSFFTSNPIVGQAMKNVDPAEQFTSSTSEFSKFVGSMAGVSPLKLDYLIRGYTGMLGAFVLDATDAVANPNRVEKPINKLPQVSTFMYDPTGRGYKSEFYRFREDVDRVVDTVNLFKREGRADELREYLTEDRLRLLAMRGVTGKIEEALGKLRKYRNIVANDPNMSGDEKAEITQEVLAREKAILLAYNVPSLRQMAIGE